MSDWSDGYVTQVDYTSHFYPHLAPAGQNLALLVRGIMPVDTSRGFSYCELGCGKGYSTALLAAANPAGQFLGVDFNPSHIAAANTLRGSAQLDNLCFVEKGFSELADAELPAFDFIALHGVWSWISTANRQAIVAFIYAKLKPGGVVYVSYNALPGWAAIAPLRQLLVESQRHKTEIDDASVTQSIELAKRIRELRAGYFNTNPSSVTNLDQMSKMSHNYVLHEYFNRDWQPFYFSDVATELKAAKLSFACSSVIVEHIDQLCLSKEAQELLKEIPDAVARETIRDYFRNQRFRRDIFTRGARRLSDGERTSMLRNTRFAAVTAAPEFPLRATFPAGAVTLGVEPHQAIMAKLVDESLTLARLMDDAPLAACGPQAVFQAVLMLIAAGHVQVALPADGESARRESSSRFNRAMLLQPVGMEAQTLASPVLGNGVGAPAVDQLILSLQSGGDVSAVEVRRLMAQRNLKLLRQSGTQKPSDAQGEEGVEAMLAEFHSQRLPKYRRLGVA